MASVSRDKNGCRRICFISPDGTRKSLRLGKMPLKLMESIKIKVEGILACLNSGMPFDQETSRWLAEIGDDLAGKLTAVGLIPPRKSSTLQAFCDDYIQSRTDLKPNTIRNLEICKRRLFEFFGPTRNLKEITVGDADRWLLWLKERHAPATVGRTVRRAVQFFRSAQRQKLIQDNPFKEIKAPHQTNEARKQYVPADAIEKIIESTPNLEWKVIIALCRYGGLRCPSELLRLTWSHVLWSEGKIRVESPKTEHHPGGAERFIPLEQSS